MTAITSVFLRPAMLPSKVALAASVLFLQMQVAYSHHSFATHYSYDELVEITGVITEFALANPHSFMDVEVSLENGETEMWEVEANSVALLRRANITEETFRVGDQVTITGMRSLDPDRRLMFGTVGESEAGELYNFIRPDWDTAAAPITLVRGVTTSLDVSQLAGVWRRIIRDGEIMNRLGDSPLPLSDNGLRGREDYDPLTSKYKDCVPVDVPSMLYLPYLIEINVNGEDIEFHHEYFNIRRRVTTDGIPGPAHETPQYGVSRGRIIRDSLVIESEGFPASQSGLGSDFDPLGVGKHIPSSSRKRFAETYRLLNDNEILEATLVLTDPEYLTEPFETTLIWTRVPEASELPDFNCDIDIARRSTGNAVTGQQ
jgi:hypothetical protein